jgi:hypothetical protein
MNLLHKSRDLEWANGYLDRALNEEEILAFAERLSQNPDLSYDISDFIRLKKLVKSLPEKKPPHNYILTRRMAAEARKPGILERFFPAFRAVALLCSLGLALTFLIPSYQTINPIGNTGGYTQKSVNEQILNTQTGDAAVEPMIFAAPDGSTGDTIDVINSEPDAMAKESGNEGFAASSGSEDMTVAEKSSHGFRGGSPKNELLIVSERVLPDERVYDPSAVFSGLEADNLDDTGSAGSQSKLLTPVEGTEQTGNIHLKEITFRIGFSMVLAVSLVWITITLMERKRIS